MSIILPDLPYKKDALAPYVSSRTMDFHYEKHHHAYVTKLNKLLEGTDMADKTIEDIIKKTVNNTDQIGIFNNAAQVWNHTFYWKGMKPGCGGLPTGPIADKIESDFGSYDNFIIEFKNAGLGQFGSGWIWLVLNNNTLEITKTSNADTPIAHGLTPLMTVDVWEHAYYLDYQNRRGDYLEAFIKNLINWEFANEIILTNKGS